MPVRLLLLCFLVCLTHPLAVIACGADEMAAARLPTPSTGTGPFYPGADAFAGMSNDLTGNLTAQGTVIVIEGTVMDANGPVKGAELHVWQADAVQGRYEHPSVPAFVPRDPGFQYLGRATTDDKGYYRFRTIVPPPYPAGRDWYRSRHVHVAVLVPGRPPFYTEMHFTGDASIEQDRFLNHAIGDLAPLLVGFVMTSYRWDQASEPRNVPLGRFDIVL